MQFLRVVTLLLAILKVNSELDPSRQVLVGISLLCTERGEPRTEHSKISKLEHTKHQLRSGPLKPLIQLASTAAHRRCSV